jgi:hypothetical protein
MVTSGGRVVQAGAEFLSDRAEHSGLTTTESSMRRIVVRRIRIAGKNTPAVLAMMALLVVATAPAEAGIGSRHIDPAQLVPLNQIAPDRRDVVIEVIRDHTFHRQGDADAFPCPSSLYLSLINEPSLTLALWKDLSDAPVQLQKVGPNRYEGTDGSGASATWEFVLRTPRLHVLLAHLNYVSPHGNARVEARIILIVNTSYYQDNKREPWVQHNVEAFVKIDSKGWKTLGRTLRPVIERILEEQVKEAGYFISLMSRLVLTYPNWANHVVNSQTTIDAATKQRFAEVVAQTRKPGASTGRPQIVKNGDEAAESRRR